MDGSENLVHFMFFGMKVCNFLTLGYKWCVFVFNLGSDCMLRTDCNLGWENRIGFYSTVYSFCF